MNKHELKKLLPCGIATVGLLGFSGLLFFLYEQAQYLLFLLGGIFSGLLGAIYLILLLFRWEPPAPSDRKAVNKDGAENKSEEGDRSDAEGETAPPDSFRKKGEELLEKILSGLLRLGRRLYRPVEILLLLAALIGGFVWFGISASIETTVSADMLEYWYLVVVVVMFVVTIILDKLCKHVEQKDRFTEAHLRNARAFFSIIRIVLLVTALGLTLKLLNIYDIQAYAVIALVILFYYVGLMLLLSLTARVIKKELSVAPGIVILLPFFNADIKELSVLSFLEENTGITFRSLWSIQYVKRLIPYALVALAATLWISTGIVYVQSHQEAAVYRLGTLQEETLAPGLHLTLPYPLEKTEIYDTKTVNKMTIGYKASENIDNVWTEAHGGDEYRLLLGSGNELVSINLRLEYQISDLKQYVSYATSPEKILEAKAYELVTERTISSDLDMMLSTNRETFAQSFRDELVEEIAHTQTGLSIVSVIMESIHPPVEVAEVYQNFIGAEIDAERMMLNAEARAIVTVAEAETVYHQTINTAKTYNYEQVAYATSEIAEFMAAIEASNAYPAEYKYYKYLEAICTAYGQARLVIVGNGVDTSRLYFANVDGMINE